MDQLNVQLQQLDLGGDKKRRLPNDDYDETEEEQDVDAYVHAQPTTEGGGGVYAEWMFHTLQDEADAHTLLSLDKPSESKESLSDQLASSIGITHIKHLLASIERHRHDVHLTDQELLSLFVDLKPGKSKWADENKVGQEELYVALDHVLSTLKAYTRHALPFVNKVSRRDAPDYYDGTQTCLL
jgi:hypothetical protein